MKQNFPPHQQPQQQPYNGQGMPPGFGGPQGPWYPGGPAQPPRPPKKQFYKQWWFWLIVAVLVIGGVASAGTKKGDSKQAVGSSTPTVISTTVVAATGQTTTANPTSQPATPNVAATSTAFANVAASAEASRPTTVPVATSTPKPTATPAPSPTPKPTSTPAPSPTPVKLSEQINLKGNSDSVSDAIALDKGATKVTFRYSGDSNFIVKVLDENGNDLDLTVNEIGSITGAKFIPVSKTGNYIFSVKAEGDWSLVIDKADRVLATYGGARATSIKGHGNEATALYVPKSGLTRFKMNHNGESNFIVYVVDPKTGRTDNLLANVIGKYNGTDAKKADEGAYLVNIQADGDWTVEVG